MAGIGFVADRLGSIAGRRVLGCAFIVALAVAVASCANPPPSGSVLHLRAFAWSDRVLCNLAAAVSPVTGALEGDPADPELVWLRSADNQRLSIVWPAGFTVRFEPGATLYDENGVLVARAGDAVVLNQVSPAQHAGSPEDPYLADGSVFAGCYPSSQ